MLQERIEPAWLEAFEAVLRRCALQPDAMVAILCETQSHPILVELARLSAARLGTQTFVLTLPPVFAAHEPAVRSTTACEAVARVAPVVAALQACTLVVDCTVQGLMHAPELPRILKGNDHTQPFVVYVSNEHPVTLTIQDDQVAHIDGTGGDAEFLRSCFAAWDGEPSPSGGSAPRAAGSVGVHMKGRRAGPPQARPAPWGGSAPRAAGSVGVHMKGRCAGPPQARPAPWGGSAPRAAGSVGAS